MKQIVRALIASLLLAGCGRRAELEACNIAEHDCQEDVYYAIVRAARRRLGSVRRAAADPHHHRGSVPPRAARRPARGAAPAGASAGGGAEGQSVGRGAAVAGPGHRADHVDASGGRQPRQQRGCVLLVERAQRHGHRPGAGAQRLRRHHAARPRAGARVPGQRGARGAGRQLHRRRVRRAARSSRARRCCTRT